MYKVKEFLDFALYNATIVFMCGNGKYERTTVNDYNGKFDDRVFSCWELNNNELYLFLD